MNGDKKCPDCRYWAPCVPRENASMAPCEHLSAYRARTPFDYSCALFAPIVEPAAAPRVWRCLCGSFDQRGTPIGMLCANCGKAVEP